jgi:hypothetical protein
MDFELTDSERQAAYDQGVAAVRRWETNGGVYARAVGSLQSKIACLDTEQDVAKLKAFVLGMDEGFRNLGR